MHKVPLWEELRPGLGTWASGLRCDFAPLTLTSEADSVVLAGDGRLLHQKLGLLRTQCPHWASMRE